MIEILTKEGKALVSESGVVSIQRDSYYPNNKDTGYYGVEIIYSFGRVSLKFSNEEEANKALDYIKDNINGIENISTGREEYIKGFKEGVEYALKLKKIPN